MTTAMVGAPSSSLFPRSSAGAALEEDEDESLVSPSVSSGDGDGDGGVGSLSLDHQIDHEVTSESSSSGGGGGGDDGDIRDPSFEMSCLLAQLPVKRGLSRYFDGKSQSFVSLARVRCLEDLVKPERFPNYYKKKTIKPSRSCAGGLDSQASLIPRGPSKTIEKRGISRNSLTSSSSSSTLASKRHQEYICRRTPPQPPPPPPQMSDGWLSGVLTNQR